MVNYHPALLHKHAYILICFILGCIIKNTIIKSPLWISHKEKIRIRVILILRSRPFIPLFCNFLLIAKHNFDILLVILNNLLVKELNKIR